jgi:hypothetical protein
VRLRYPLSQSRTVAQEVAFTELLNMARPYHERQLCQQGVRYYDEIVQRVPPSEHAAFALYRTGQSYLAYDVSHPSDVSHQQLLQEHRESPWTLALLLDNAEAQPPTGAGRMAPATTYRKVAEVAGSSEDACAAELAAASAMAETNECVDSITIISSVLESTQSEAWRAQATHLRTYVARATYSGDQVLKDALSW